MLYDKDMFLTISQFAALFNLNKNTLMWYDKVGIFKPALVKENGYRFYSYFQYNTLETILNLRELDVSIKEIQSFIDNRSSESLSILLDEKIIELDQKILKLKSIKKNLIEQKNIINLVKNIDLSKITIIECDQKFLLTIKTSKEISLEKDMENFFNEIKRKDLFHLKNKSLGAMISVKNLNSGNFKDYSYLFITTDTNSKDKMTYIQPKGKYLQAFYRGKWDKLPDKYIEILEYCKLHNIVLTDYSYETLLNENTVNYIEDAIVLINIPIAK